ncbi:protein serine/threonine kinase, putative [Entamoeba invadens IP1]|uniref:Protein serine/threonine kinase, putative n=1 Tax=Entamoeba invadens IP1 TaxID=370355 RepID=A0A0A1UB61_ENTIV|nr:protein serine/threonine kinase, putative [Entamoeba invadens IP1]ELP92345.1 protein serine/threonine kinase, putative [Entamoeba invadens IP1]|eukprot:XP_004259116.1 protein serine/threonine kinase, putative [Entamoeba invadens IP1]
MYMYYNQWLSLCNNINIFSLFLKLKIRQKQKTPDCGYSPMYDTTNSEIVQCANNLTTGQYWWCGSNNENIINKDGYCIVQNCDDGVGGSKGTAGICNRCSSSYPYYYENNCHECRKGFYYNGTDCDGCMNGCIYCYNEDTCEMCLNGYYFYNMKCHECEIRRYTTIDGCADCINGCESCISGETCESCYVGFYKYNETCYVCPEGCSTCNLLLEQVVCITCSVEYYLNMNSCIKCKNCSSCDQKGCFGKTCLEGFYGKRIWNVEQQYYEYQCIACLVECSSCRDTTCSKCFDGYYIKDSKCLECGGNCSQCNLNVCLECVTGFYFQLGNCVTCPNTCSLCSTTSAECTQCQQNYVFQNPKTAECESCSSFDTNCKTCDSSFFRRCYECQTGYYPSLTTYKCTKCSSTCESNGCNTYTGVCQTCADNYTITSTPGIECGLCSDFDSNCEMCSKTTRKCNKCKAGYYPQTVYPYKCILCDITCNGQCDAITGYCTSCISDYVLTLNRNSLKCESCQTFEPNCKSCAFNGERKCLTCVNKYKPASNGTCIKCDSTCLDNCDGTSGICTKCVSGYVPYNPTQTTCQECSNFDTKCINCATNNTRICNECKLPFYPSQSGQNIGQCIECDSTCADCDTTNGNCKKCSTANWVVTEPISIRCEMCSTFDSNCEMCSNDSSRVCTTCKSGLRPNTTSGKCVGCGLHCASGACNPTSGICNQCDTNYVFQSTKTDQCESCSTFEANCITCASDSTRKCSVCKAGYYPKTSGDYKCQSCDATCGGKCDTTTGVCAGCTSGYVPTLPITNKCVTCRTYDTNCVECVSDKRECAICQSGMYPNTNGTCTLCDATCNGQCNTSTGVCTGCTTNHVFTDPPGKVCVACNSFDTNCITCSPDFLRKCKVCAIGFYPDETSGKCVACSTIPDCNTCSSDAKKCLTCKDPFIQKSGGCESCPIGEYKFSETTCSKCYNTIDNCNTCDTIAVGKARCNLCISPYVLNGTKCGLCQSNEYFDNTTGTPSCVKNNINCDILQNKESCLDCSDTFFVSNSKFVSSGSCESPTLTSCDCSDQISINSKCTPQMDRCKYQKSEKGVSTCITCVDNFILNYGGVCEQQSVYGLVRNGVVFGCKTGTYLTNQNTCDSCVGSNAVCATQNKYLTCGDLKIFDVQQMACTTDTQCNSVVDGLCFQCKENDMEISKGKCSKCETENCDICVGGTCQICKVNYLMYSANRCVNKEQVNCKRTNQSGCAQCEAGYYQVDTKNIEGKYDFCTKTDVELHCKYYSLNTTKCIECQDAFKMKDGMCAEQFDDLNKVNETKTSVYNMKSALKTQEEVDCLTRNNKGCQRCPNGYYLNKNSCEKCVNDCLSCYNATYCTTCNSGYFLDLSMKCQTLGELANRCEVPLPTGGGCAICKVGYFKVEKDCDACDESCDMCLKKDECLSCKDGYIKIASESNKLCSSNTTLSNCLQSNLEGCILCNESFFLQNGRCFSCKKSCATCVNSEKCLSCGVDKILLKGSCVDYRTVTHCTSADNSKCTSCEGSNKVSDDGESCVSKTNYGMVIGIPVALIFIMIFLLFLLVYLTLRIHQKRIQHKVDKKVCTFNMKRSNIPMFSLCDSLCTNKEILKFDLENNEFIPVDKETRDLICIGNTSKHNMKVQLSVMNGCDYYTIRSEPSLVTLHKGEACEFEIFITPLCSCQINDKVAVIALDITNGQQITTSVTVNVTTEQSTKLNYRELEEFSQIGEGSFGVVFKGTFRGNTVAIKKMKLSGEEDDNVMIEFENEVNMLDKFRSEYIVHFYGAVFIPNKVCMVTEFAQYGSLQDLIKHKKREDIDIKLRIKMMIDAAKGILYLHENGILHRDIKPDNILVISLNIDDKVIAKLTDFGSARNVNLLMTNMTFTKGIGTPVYMAPEILKKDKYKKPADIYSFGVTMYECIGWCQAYSKHQFRFPWKIAEFVINGKRVEKKDNMPQEFFDIIQKCWAQDISKRIDATTIVNLFTDITFN